MYLGGHLSFIFRRRHINIQTTHILPFEPSGRFQHPSMHDTTFLPAPQLVSRSSRAYPNLAGQRIIRIGSFMAASKCYLKITPLRISLERNPGTSKLPRPAARFQQQKCCDPHLQRHLPLVNFQLEPWHWESLHEH